MNLTDKKVKYGFYLTPELNEKIERYMSDANCTTRSDFVENALLFYISHLSMNSAMYLLPDSLSEMITGILDSFGDRIGSLLFKQAVEQDIMNHIFAYSSDIDEVTYEKMRGRCTREVMRTKGKISLKDAIQFQKSV